MIRALAALSSNIQKVGGAKMNRAMALSDDSLIRSFGSPG